MCGFECRLGAMDAARSGVSGTKSSFWQKSRSTQKVHFCLHCVCLYRKYLPCLPLSSMPSLLIFSSSPALFLLSYCTSPCNPLPEQTEMIDSFTIATLILDPVIPEHAEFYVCQIQGEDTSAVNVLITVTEGME